MVRASCTRFSPKSRNPAAIAELTWEIENVFDTAISCTELEFRPADRDAMLIRSCTAEILERNALTREDWFNVVLLEDGLVWQSSKSAFVVFVKSLVVRK